LLSIASPTSADGPGTTSFGDSLIAIRPRNPMGLWVSPSPPLTAIQDEIAIALDHLTLTIGAKLEHNDYSGFGTMPSVVCLG
jgi:hypothetical protein